jgi:hypothetical protein
MHMHAWFVREVVDYGGIDVGQPSMRMLSEEMPAAGHAPFSKAVLATVVSDSQWQ